MIEIKNTLKPFSFTPGAHCLIPGSFFSAQIFPALIRLFDGNDLIKEVALNFVDPFSPFMVIQDLERGHLKIKRGKEELYILPNLEVTKRKPPFCPSKLENLSLGSHKAQEFEKIQRRADFKELFPLWLRLGTLLPKLSQREESGGVFTLLDECRKAISLNKPENILKSFRKLFLSGFSAFLVPSNSDPNFCGFVQDKKSLSALYLIQEGREMILKLFYELSENGVSILPNLPPEFFSGRLLNLRVGHFGTLHLEWSKKMIRRVIFESSYDGTLFFGFDSSLKSARINQERRDLSIPLEIKSGELYLWDRFQK